MHTHTGNMLLLLFSSFRSFTQWLTSFDPKFLPSIWKSLALEKKSGLVILSSEMEQKVSKCDFHESLVSHIGLWASACKVLLATHWILPSSNKGLSFWLMHSSKLRIFQNILEKVNSAQLVQILPQRPGLCGAGVCRVWRVVVVHSSLAQLQL